MDANEPKQGSAGPEREALHEAEDGMLSEQDLDRVVGGLARPWTDVDDPLLNDGRHG